MIAIMNNYTYVKTYTLKRKRGSRWSCSTTKPEKCPAALILRENGTVRRVLDSHLHPPPLHYINQHVLMVKGRHGKDLLMLNGYTYYQHKILRDGFRWSCTQMGSRSCRGFLHVTNEMLVVRAHTEHTHPPSKYYLKNIKAATSGNDHYDHDGRQGINPLALKIASVQGRAGF